MAREMVTSPTPARAAAISAGFWKHPRQKWIKFHTQFNKGIECGFIHLAWRCVEQIQALLTEEDSDPGKWAPVHVACTAAYSQLVSHEHRKSNEEWRGWARRAVESPGGKTAHSFSKVVSEPPVRHVVTTTGEATSSPTAQLEGQVSKWEALWCTGLAPPELEWETAITEDLIAAIPLLTPDTLRDCSKSFKRPTTKVDGWHPRQYQHLSDIALRCLALLFRAYEARGEWCSHQCSLLVCLIPKPNGDRRPILHFRSGYRVWARARQAQVREWATTHVPDPAINNAAGRAPGDAVWRSLVRADLKAADGLHTAEFLWDVSKAFDRVPRRALLARARDMKYPLTLLRLSLASYSWKRRLVDFDLASRALHPWAGIGAGSPFATYELICLIIKDLRGFQSRNIYATISLPVDELRASLSHPSGAS